MGALSAIFSKNGPIPPRIIEKMLAAAPHRGAVVRMVSQDRAMVAVAAPVDRTDAWLSQRDGLTAAFAGVLDNSAALVERLPPSAPPLGERNPADLLLEMFRASGEAALKDLRGAFAGIVTDGTRFIAFRDHLGFGPLFYRDDEHRLAVASEAKQILAGAGLPFEPDLAVVEQIFFRVLKDEGACALKGIRRLPRSSFVSVTPGKTATIHHYWYPERLLETGSVSDDDLLTRFNDLMTQSVTRMLTGEDVIAISGGIDSNAVAAFAAPTHFHLTGRPLPALSQVFPDLPRVDERRYVEQVADYLGLDLHTYTSEAGHFDRLDHWVRLADSPPLAMLEEMAYEHRVVRGLGLRTVLTGEFGEFVYDMGGHVLTHLAAARRFTAIWERLRAPAPVHPTWKTVAREILAASMPRPVALAYRRLAARRPDPRVPDWLQIPKAYQRYALQDPSVRPQLRWRMGQMAAFRGPGIGLESAEMCATAHGVTVRRPLCDVDLWEFFLSLPAEVKFPDTRSKTLIRRLLRGKLPDTILDRSQKTYFDDYVLSRVDYPTLKKWLLGVPYRMVGVDYELLRDRLERHNFNVTDYVWGRELAAIHAFMSLW